MTSLIKYIQNYNVPKILELIKTDNVNINAQNNRGNSGLHHAVKNGDHEVIKLLLSHPKININIKNNSENSPFTLALNSQELINIFLSRQDFDVNSNKKLFIEKIATVYKPHKIVKKMISKGLKFKKNDIWGIIHRKIDIKLIKLLLSLKLIDINDIDKNGNTLLSLCYTDKQRKFCLDNKACPNICIKKMIKKKISQKTFKLLIRYGLNHNMLMENKSLVMIMIDKYIGQNLMTIKFLLENNFGLGTKKHRQKLINYIQFKYKKYNYTFGISINRWCNTRLEQLCIRHIKLNINKFNSIMDYFNRDIIKLLDGYWK